MKMSVAAWCLRALLCALLSVPVTQLWAGETMMQSSRATTESLHYLAAGQTDAATLLPPPPLPGSAEQAADLEEVRAVHHAASADDTTMALAQRRFSVFSFTPVIGTFFLETNLPKTTAFFDKVQRDAEIVTDKGKDFFQRPRPFVIDPTLASGKLEKSFSYPSGHSTESMVLALVLADLLPEKRDAILAEAREIGWHRVQIARHYPTDIYAGRVLALAIVKEFRKSAEYQAAFAQAKAEMAAAQAAGRN
ncbi:MAG TPA: phosphatase PAP2 family protein [Verrucomicrobiae bacterium]